MARKRESMRHLKGRHWGGNAREERAYLPSTAREMTTLWISEVPS